MQLPLALSRGGWKLLATQVFLLAFLGSFLAASEAQEHRTTGLQFPASAAFDRWLNQQRGSRPGSGNPQALITGVELAQARAKEMRALMEENPKEFTRRAISAEERAQLPAQVQPFVEQRIKGRGFFGVYCVGLPSVDEDRRQAAPRNGYARDVVLNGSAYRAFVFGRWREQTTVADAYIEGIALDDAMVIGGEQAPGRPSPARGSSGPRIPTTTGTNTLLYMIARFSDEVSDPIDNATALSQMEPVSIFWLNNSAGTVALSGLVNPTQVMDIVHIVLPRPKSYGPTYNNNLSQLLADARNAASAQGYNYTNYNLDAVVTSNQGFNYAGRAYIGGQGCHLVKPNTTLRTAGHELGHNLGLNHANYWRTDSNKPFGKDSIPGGYVADTPNGEWLEYGHYFCVMSGQSGSEMDDPTKPHYNPAEKVQLGWLSGDQVKYAATNGTYRLFRHDARTTVGNPRGIRIETPAADYTGYARHYWLSYRYAPWATAQNWYRNGVEVDVAASNYGFDGVTMLDMTPYSRDASLPFFDANSKPANWWAIDNDDKLDGALLVGRTYDDVSAGIHITPIATGSNGANEYIDVVINLGKFPANRPPIIAGFSVSSNQVATSQSVSFSVTASDPDGDSLSYSWDFDDAESWTQNSLNSPIATKSWASPGQYRVTATVSDMKGGIATSSLLVTVGTAADVGQISGRVVWAGQPIYGARVSAVEGASVRQAWTASDGTYLLAGLASTKSYNLQCRSDGLTFSGQFSNPISMAAGNAYGKDFYANEPLPWGLSSTFALSGQVTYGGAGVAGVEVRAGAMVTTTDWAGNYQFTNFPNGTYTVTSRKENWSFSPASRTVTINSADSSSNDFSRFAPYSISGRIDGLPATTNDSAPLVMLSNGGAVEATLAGVHPNTYWAYTLTNVPAGHYGVSAWKWSYTLEPSGFTNLLSFDGDFTNISFIATTDLVAGSIIGRITEQGLPVEGIIVEATNGGSVTVSSASDSDGYYSIDNLPDGTYSVTPNSPAYSFSPASLADVYAGTSDNDFIATGSNTPPVISSILANPPVVPNAASNATLSVIASGSAPLSYTWDLLAGNAPVTFNPNDSPDATSTLVSFQAPGSYIFRVRVTDSHGFSVTSNVNLTVSPLPATMVVAPYQVQILVGSSVGFHADAWDELGGRVTLTPSWSVNGGSGSISSSGVFSATGPGPATISALAGTLSASATAWAVSTNQVPILVISPVTRDSYMIRLDGLPGMAYRIEYADTLENPVWQMLITGAADQFGVLQNIDTPPPGAPSRYYRAVCRP